MAKPKPFSFADIYNTLIGGFSPIGKGPLGRRASIETQLQYGPTLQALMQLGQQTSQQHNQTITGIRRGGLAAAQSIGQIGDNFQTQIKDLPNLSEKAMQNLGLTREAVGGSLARMQAQQVAGINSGLAQERTRFQQGRSDILSQMLQAAQKGSLYNQGQYEGYANDAAKAREARKKFDAQQRAALIRSHINPDTMRYDPSLDRPAAPKADPINAHGYSASAWAALPLDERRRIIAADKGGGGRNGMTPAARRQRIEKYGQIRDTIGSISDTYKRVSGMRIHINPQTGAAVSADKTGAYPDGTTTRPAKPGEIAAAIAKQFPHASPLVIRAANELAHGFLTTGTINDLKRRYKAFQVPHEWHPPRGYGVLAPR